MEFKKGVAKRTVSLNRKLEGNEYARMEARIFFLSFLVQNHAFYLYHHIRIAVLLGTTNSNDILTV